MNSEFRPRIRLAGDSVPGDCLILEAKDVFLDESALTGETFPVG